MNATHYRSLFILPAMICVLGTASLLAQTDTSVDAVSATSEATPSEAPNMPDISGVWQIRSWSPQSAGKIDEIEIRRTENSSEEFEPSLTHVPKGLPIPRIHWLVGTRKFEWNWKNPSIPDGGMKAAMQVAGDDQSIRVTIEVDETTTKLYAEQGMTEAQIDELLNQVWTRKPKDVAQSASAEDSNEKADRTYDPNMPDISGMWVSGFVRTATNAFPSRMNYYITRAADHETYQFLFRSRGSSPFRLRWRSDLEVFESESKDNSLKVEAKSYLRFIPSKQQINSYSVILDEDEDIAERLKSILNPDPDAAKIKGLLSWTEFTYQGKYGQTEGLELVVSETADGLSGFSKKLGRWTAISVPLPKDGSPRIFHVTVGKNLAAAVIDDLALCYSSETGRWARMTIPEEYVSKFQVTVGNDLASIQVGDKYYTFSPQSIAWTSPDMVTDFPNDESVPIKKKLPQLQREGSGLFSPPENRVPLARDSSEFQQLTARIQQHEAQAAELARSFASASDETAARKQIETELAEAMDLKFQREELQVKELQFRLSQLEQQIGRRKALREQIIERRVQELLNHEETQWEDETETARQEVGGNLQRAARTIPVNPSSTHRYNNLATPESSAPAQKLDHNIVIDLYAGDGIYARKSKLHGKSIGDIVKPLKKLPDVIVNIKIAGEGDQFVMATIRDQSQRCQRDTNLRASILTVLKEAEIKTIRWEEFVEERGSSAGNSLPEDVEYPDTP